MPNYIKQIFHTQVFSILNIIFGFGTLYLLVKYMQIAEYGEYVLIQGFIALSGLLLSQNIYSYARLYIPGAEQNIQYGYLKTVIVIVFSGYFLVAILSKILNFEDYIWNFFEIDNTLGSLVLTMLGFELINLEFMRFFIAIKKIQLKNYIQFFQKVFVLIAVLILLYLKSLTLTNFLYIFITGQLLVFLSSINILDTSQLIHSSLISDVVKKGYKVAIPLLPIGLMSIALNYTDTLMIAKLIDKEQVAQYGFASQIIAIAMMMIGSSIILTLFPYATEAHNKNDVNKRTYFFMKMYKYGTALAFVFYLFIISSIQWLISLLHLDNYSNVPSYIYILGTFPFFQLIYSVSSHHLQLMKAFMVQIYSAFFIILENIILNYIFIYKYGVLGAAYASLVSYITLCVIFLIFTIKKDEDLKEKIFKIKKIVL